MAKTLNVQIKADTKQNVTLSIYTEDLNKLKSFAEDYNTTIVNIVRHCINEFFDREASTTVTK